MLLLCICASIPWDDTEVWVLLYRHHSFLIRCFICWEFVGRCTPTMGSCVPCWCICRSLGTNAGIQGCNTGVFVWGMKFRGVTGLRCLSRGVCRVSTMCSTQHTRNIPQARASPAQLGTMHTISRRVRSGQLALNRYEVIRDGLLASFVCMAAAKCIEGEQATTAMQDAQRVFAMLTQVVEESGVWCVLGGGAGVSVKSVYLCSRTHRAGNGTPRHANVAVACMLGRGMCGLRCACTAGKASTTSIHKPHVGSNKCSCCSIT